MAVNGIRRNIIPRDDLFIDYLWYRTCQINGYSDYTTPSNNDLEEKLRQAVITPTAEQFMRESDRRNNELLGLERWVDTLKNEFDYNCLKQDDFLWLEDNARQCCYIWRLISHLAWEEKNKDDERYAHIMCQTVQTPSSGSSVRYTVGMQNIDNHTVSRLDIIHFINRLSNTKYRKMEFVRNLKINSSSALKNRDMINWFSNEKKQKTEWLSGYLSSDQYGYVELTMPGSDSRTNDLISFFDVLYTLNEDKCKWITINIKKSWSQRVYREKNKTKKQYSINMSHDIGDILDKLSLARNENKNAIVEALIRAEYNKLPR
ncbi:hypothetical protein [Aeromonas hydrophila]|uniref:hypothetical protein n=1 Tax=Aeromonas hydrophila TaxID=644 RepID=UPI003019733B